MRNNNPKRPHSGQPGGGGRRREGGGGHSGHSNHGNGHSRDRYRRHGNGGGGGGDDARVRKNATAAREKYLNMARDAMSYGDRVLAEFYLQHADHYYRVLAELPPEEVQQPRRRSFAGEGQPLAEHGEAAESSQPAHHSPQQAGAIPGIPPAIPPVSSSYAPNEDSGNTY